MNDKHDNKLDHDHKHDHDHEHDHDHDKKHEHHTPEINKAALSGSATEAWADAKCVDKETNMNYPSSEAVKNAKEWVEENEK